MTAETNAEVIAEFRANHGEVAAPYPNPPPMILLHTTGRRTGRDHITPMRARPDGDGWLVFASAHGSDRDPDWYRNLVASPDAAIEIGTRTVPVRATVLTGPERDRHFAAHAAAFPVFADYQDRLPRTIPVVRLSPRGA